MQWNFIVKFVQDEPLCQLNYKYIAQSLLAVSFFVGCFLNIFFFYDSPNNAISFMNKQLRCNYKM